MLFFNSLLSARYLLQAVFAGQPFFVCGGNRSMSKLAELLTEGDLQKLEAATGLSPLQKIQVIVRPYSD